jgi:hypothetical protein
MDKRARVRWIILLAALALTVAAIFFPTSEFGVVEPAASVSSAGKSATLMDSATVDMWAPREAPPSDVDPFAPRGWVAPAAVPIQAAPAAAPSPVASVDLAPAAPPELPFRFVGGFNDDADHVVYLARGEQSYVARQGEVIDNDYKVVGISQTQIEFEHLPTGAKQALSFPAPDR